MKKNILLFVACVVFGLIVPTFSKAQTTINFDDLTDNGFGTVIANGYQTFDWNNFYVLNTSKIASFYGPNGYSNNLVSAPNVALNAKGDAASITSSTPFTFNSADFGAAWNDGLSITVDGLLSGTLEDSVTFTVGTSGPPTLETFNWANINELTFQSSGGTNVGYHGAGTEFALDNMTFDAAPTPEPPSFFLVFGGLLFAVIKLLRGR